MAGVKGKSGRETELTPAIAQGIVDAVRAGLPEGRAAMAAGFTPAASSGWKRRGEAAIREGRDTVHAKFVKALIAADVAFEQVRLACIVTASRSPKTWQASAWLLERKFPQWRKVTQLANDPTHPLPASGGAVIILPDNGRGDSPAKQSQKKPKNAKRGT